MIIEDYLNKWQLTEDIDLSDFIGFMITLDYLYCHLTKEQLIELISDYYDNADEIYNEIICNQFERKNSKYKS